MPRTLVLHVGTMKSGTSFLQSALLGRVDDLAVQGVDFLGGRFVPQVRAVKDVMSGDGERWDRLVRSAAPGRTSVVSMEFLGFADDAQAARVLAPVAADDRVEVVLTVRDQLAALPSQWQSYARNRGTLGWADYVAELRGAPGERPTDRKAARSFHRAQDADRVVATWSAQPAVSAVHVVTVPPSGAPPEVLLDRFCGVLGAELPADAARAARSNASLGYESCTFLTGVNAAGAPAARRSRARSRAVRGLSRGALFALRAGEGRPVLDRTGAEYAVARNARLREALAGADCHLVGDLGDLDPAVDLACLPDAPPPPDPAGVRRAAQAALAHLDPGAEVPDDLDLAALTRRAAALLDAAPPPGDDA